MEIILVHKPIGLIPPESMKLSMDRAKELCAKPQEFVPGSKLIGSYTAIGAQVIFCIWDVPNTESLLPLLRNMSIAGWNTEIIPVERTEVAIPNIEKAMAAMQAQPVGR